MIKEFIYAAIAVLLVVFLIQIGRDADPKGKEIKKQIYLVLGVDIICLVFHVVTSQILLYWANSVIRILENWIIYSFLAYACLYADSSFLRNKARKGIIIAALCADSIMLLLLDLFPMWYAVHVLICLGLLAGLVALMVRKAFRIPHVYRWKYIGVSVLFAASIAAYGFFLCQGKNRLIFPFVLFYVLGVVIYYLTYDYVPRLRSRQMKNFVINHMANPVLMFDCDDVLQVYNQAAVDILQIRPEMTLNEFIQDSNLRYLLTPERRKQGKTKEFSMATEIGGKVYLISGQEKWDEKNRFIGAFMIYNDITDQENMKDEATYHATHDQLTGMWNRDYFFEAVEKTMGENADEVFLMVASDISQFKMLNDILGKKLGDEILISVARNFHQQSGPMWEFARMSGDRFAALIPKKDFREDAFVGFCRQSFSHKEYTLTVHNYIGVYEITDRRLNPQQMYDRAYMALESIKGSMHTNVAYYEEEIRKKKIDATLTADELEQAMEEKQFVIYLQPQINPVNRKVAGGEALVRWISPKRGVVSPAEFIPLFEQNGMIAKLDYYVWEMACLQLAEWKRQGKEDWSISINISPKDFYLSDLYEEITGLVEKYEVSPEKLKLEITESAFVLDVKEQMQLVKRLQERGFLVEIDDFGSGYSSLNSLKDISVDILKLDMKFFEETDDPARSEKIIESMIDLAHNLKMPVIAEGVEDSGQVEMLKRFGCEMIQGFYYSRPLPVEEYEKFMQTREVEDVHSFIKALQKEET